MDRKMKKFERLSLGEFETNKWIYTCVRYVGNLLYETILYVLSFLVLTFEKNY